MSCIQEVTRMLTEADKGRTWGQIQIDLQDGRPVVIRQTVTRKLDEGNNRHEYRATSPR